MQRSSALCWGRVLLSVLCLTLPAAAGAQDGAAQFRIPAKPLAEALVDFALQARLSISDTGVEFHSTISKPLAGTFARDVALAHLLAGTGYGFEFLDTNTVRILRQTGAAAIIPAVETVIVTATKREEIAQRIPYSIVVIDGRQIEQSGILSPTGLTGEVAGLTATNLGPGQDKLFIRGLTDSVLPGLSESMVGLYLDETRIADDAPDPDLRLIDVNRTEILRGPQGTLYGAGSLGGLVRIVTRKPVLDDFDSAAHASLSETEDGGVSTSADAVLNIPIVRDELGLRIVGYAEHSGGYLDELRLNRKDANNADTVGGRAALAWQPSSNWTINAAFAYQHIRAGDSQYYIKGSEPFTRSNYLLEPHADSFISASVTLEGDLGWAQLVSSTGLVNRRLNDRYDASLAWNGLTGFPLGASPFDVDRKIRAYTHETRLVSTGGGRWQWLAGIYLSHRDEDFQSRLSGPNAIGAIVSARGETREDRANEAAVFGEATYAPTDWLSITAGGRAFLAARIVSAYVTDLTSPAIQVFHGANRQPGFTPKLVVALHPSADTTLYAQYTQGYRLGGVNAEGPTGTLNASDRENEHDNAFDSDTLLNYEAGVKWSGFRNHVVANGAAYFTVWRNVQTDQIAPNGAYFTANAGTVRDSGIEFDLTARMLRHLTLRSNAFWNNPELTNPNPLIVAEEGVLPGAPDVSFGASARYDIPLGRGADAWLAASYNYVGKSHLGFSVATPAMGGYHLAGIRTGLSWNRWSLSLFLNNLFDDRGNTFAFGNPFNPGGQITPPRPRTTGVQLSFE